MAAHITQAGSKQSPIPVERAPDTSAPYSKGNKLKLRRWARTLPLLLRRTLPLCRLCTSRWLGLRKRRLRSEHLHERLVGALLVRIPAAHADCADQLVLDHDRQTAWDEVIGEAFLLAEVQPNQTAIDGVEALRDGGRRCPRIKRGLGLHQSCL